MSKRVLLIVVVLVLLTIGGVTGYFVLSSKGTSSEARSGRSFSIIPKTSQKEKTEVKAEVLYEDTSGFSFRYPKGVKVSDVTPEDDTYYSQLNLAEGSEKMTITLKDTSSKTIDAWFKSDPIYSGASLVGATTLGGISAKQYAKSETLITVALDQGILYLIEGPKDGAFWEEAQNAIVPTFSFATASKSSSSSSSSSNIEYEEEEVVE